MLHHYICSASEDCCERDPATSQRRRRLRGGERRGPCPCAQAGRPSPGPLSRPVSASRSGWNSSRPFLPVAALSASVSACQGSSDQSSVSATPPRPRPAAARHGRAPAARSRRASTGEPVGEIATGARGCGAAAANPPRSRRRGRRSATAAIIELVEQPGVEQLDLVRVEMRRRPAEMREVEARRRARRGWRPARPAATCRSARAATAAPSARRPPRADARRRRSRAASTACPRPRPAAPRARTAAARRPAPRTSAICDGAVRDMVLAAHDVGDAKVDVVDHARQQVEPAAVLAPDDRVAEQLRDRTSARRG